VLNSENKNKYLSLTTLDSKGIEGPLNKIKSKIKNKNKKLPI